MNSGGSGGAVHVLDYEVISAAGAGREAMRRALLEQRSGLRANDFPHSSLPTWIGRVAELDEFQWPASLARWNSRNNALALLGLRQGGFLESVGRLRERFSPARVGVVIGSSTSSIDRTEAAYRDLDEAQHLAPEFNQPWIMNAAAPSLFVAEATGLCGPNLTISTACSSSAKVFATAARWLAADLVDAVLVGGVDTLCLSVLHGFHSLQLISPQACRPLDAARNGINIGEAAGFALLVRPEADDSAIGIALAGHGESSDAYHMSHPHPEGLGARLAMESALQGAGLERADIDYINLHGTASQANDLIEGQLVGRLFAGGKAQASSTKGWTGHTLGAAGILEAIVVMEVLRHGFLPACLNLDTLDPRLDLPVVRETQQRPLRHALSNSFGFGGNNCSLVFSRLEAD